MINTCVGCESYIDDDLYDDPCGQSCIDSDSDLTEEDTDNDYVRADKEVVWSLAYEKIYRPTICTPSRDFPTFYHFVAPSVRCSCFNSRYFKSMSE